MKETIPEFWQNLTYEKTHQYIWECIYSSFQNNAWVVGTASSEAGHLPCMQVDGSPAVLCVLVRQTLTLPVTEIKCSQSKTERAGTELAFGDAQGHFGA